MAVETVALTAGATAVRWVERLVALVAKWAGSRAVMKVDWMAVLLDGQLVDLTAAWKVGGMVVGRVDLTVALKVVESVD